MKRIISVIASVLIMISCTCSVALSANANEKAAFSIGNIESQAGDTVEVPIEINNNPGITAFRIIVEYDSSILKLTNITFKEAAQGFNTGTSQMYDSPYSISGYNSETDINNNGQLAVLTFEINQYAKDGKYDISLSYDSDDVFNIAGDNVGFTLTNGYITIVSCQHIDSEWEYLKEETCTDAGIMAKRCEICGSEYDYIVVNAKGHSYADGKITKSATCIATGTKTYTCTDCGETKTEVISKKAHTYKAYVTKATVKRNGSIVTKCSVCGSIKSKSTIYYPKTIKLSSTSYTYSGKVRKPTVTVKNSKGNKISSKYYTVTYSKGRKNVGKYTVTVKFKGNYSGTVNKTFTIKPKGTSISKLTPDKKKFTVKWKKRTTQTTGYQIQYSTSSKFKNAAKIKISKNKTTSKTVTKLEAKKKYYVRVRTYRTVKVNGKPTKIYSSWSKVKTVKTK